MDRKFIAGLILIILATLLSSASSWPFWSGDAIIHLVYAENAANGRWFEYNPGEKSVGTTSIGWTFLMTMLLRIFGLECGLILQKVILLVAVVALPIITFLFLGRIAGRFSFIALLAGLVVAANPGSAFNGPLGMENPVFALFVLICLLTRFSLVNIQEFSPGHALVSGLFIGAAMLLRPEGVVLAGIVFAAGFFMTWRSSNRRKCAKNLVICLAGAMLPVACGCGFLYSHTGVVFGGASAQARVMQARILSWELVPGLLYLEPKVLIRAGANLPAAIAVIIFPLLFYRRLTVCEPADEKNRELVMACAACTFVVAAFVLYGFVTGAAHLGRYIIPVIPCAATVLGFVLLDQQAVSTQAGKRMAGLLAVVFAWYLGVYGVEWYLRMRDPGQRLGIALSDIVKAADPQNRESRSDAFLQAHGLQGATPGRPAGIGCVEVQARFDYDERVRIISLDGRIWPVGTPKLFDDHGSILWIEFLRNFRPDLIVEKPQYTRPGFPDLVSDCFKMETGRVVSPASDFDIIRTESGLSVRFHR